MDAQQRKELKEAYDLTEDQLTEMEQNPYTLIDIDNGQQAMVTDEDGVPPIVVVEGVEYVVAEDDEAFTSLEEYLKYIKENEIYEYDVVLGKLMSKPFPQLSDDFNGAFMPSEEEIKNIWDNI